MSARPPERAFYLGSSPAGGVRGDPGVLAPGTLGGDTFAVLHPAAEPRRPRVVLLCPPFGWDDMCSYRIRREWAEQLAQAGYATLRFDLPGEGDSAGDPADPGRLEAWSLAVERAAHWLRREQGAELLTAIGIGLGGMLACRAAARGAPVDELVLWSVPARGRALMRELRTFARLEQANRLAPGEPAGDDEPADPFALVVNGYPMSAETVRDLEDLDVAELGAWAHPPRRALVLGRDGLKADARLVQALEGAGAEATVTDGPGFGAMMTEPQDARPPREVFATIDSWLESGSPLQAAANTSAPAAAKAPAGEAAAADELTLEYAGATLRERPVSLEGPGGRLFGVLTEPLGERAQLTALLLNAGPQRRIGPNRMWVQIARRWAAKGVCTLRLDADGIGDADGDTSALGQVTAFYRPRYVEQARAAVDALAARGLPPRFVALGLCSGGYWGAQAALADERVAAVIMLNPRTLVFDEWHHAVRRTRHLRERALMPSTWGRVLRGEIKLRKHVETTRTVVGRAASAPLRARQRVAARRDEQQRTAGAAYEPIEGLFDALRDRGQRALLLFTGQEVLHRELAEKGVLARMERWPNLELVVKGTSAETHTLTPLWLQREVHDLVDRLLETELARLASR